MNVQVRVATEADKELYKNLVNMYHNELGLYCSEFQDVDNNGYFDNHYIESYFSGDKSVMPLVITVDDRTVGFAVLTVPPYCIDDCDFCVQEFFIVGYYRGTGVSIEAMEQIFALFKGKYCTAVLSNNDRGIEFFRKAFHRNIVEMPYAGNFILFETTIS